LEAKELLELFSIPVFLRQYEDVENLNHRLNGCIMERIRCQTLGVLHSNRGGWQSKHDLLEWDCDAVPEFKARLLDVIHEYFDILGYGIDREQLNAMSIEAWANVNGKGAYNSVHDHLRNFNQWSGIYYVDCGGDISERIGGETVFEDRENKDFYYPHSINRVPVCSHRRESLYQHRIKPSEGMFVLFPGTAWHRVTPYEGSDLRITIAFNFKSPLFEYKVWKENTSNRFKVWMWRNFRGVMVTGRKVKSTARRLMGVGNRA
jgi:uncharacterized protein (TIGR02466 family)